MTAGLMRRVSTLTRACGPKRFIAPALPRQTQRTLANIRHVDAGVSETWFNSSAPYLDPSGTGGRNDESIDQNRLKLGKTIRTLHDRLPSLLNSPLPQEILSPQITLHLFPSTHPHLPTVKGKIAYTAALWTAPVAWGRVPVVGNVKLIILSERMVRNGMSAAADLNNEKLIVRWKTCGKSKDNEAEGLYRGISAGEHMDKITEVLRTGTNQDEEFCGLFIFEFDEEGRIAKHTIEHADEGASWDKMPRVISVTDWLLGRARGKKTEDEGTPGLALGYCGQPRRVDLKGSQKGHGYGSADG